MGKRLNDKFLAAYMELDKNCCEKFGVATGGVTEYINRLNNSRFAPGRDEALPRLVRYRKIRNNFAHDIGALRRDREVTKTDIAWVKKFDRCLLKKKDPISTYLRRARNFARRKRLKRYLTVSAFILLIAIIAVLIIALK